ncbi:MAG: HEPN domain-containing protein [Candidatus Aenigmatarchaeota archaeon]
MAEAEFLKERAESFFRDAELAIKETRWNSAAFHLEQACQLYLKYFLFKKIGDFPKTHSLRRLLKSIGKAYSKEEDIDNFVERNEEVLFSLEQAYIVSRYLPVEFSEKQVNKMLQFFKELLTLLQNL